MKIVIDIREACREKRTGKGQWTYGFLKELLQREVDIELLSDSQCEEFPCTVFSGGPLWHLRAKSHIETHGADLFLSPTSFIVPALLKSTPCIPVVHDLIAFRGELHDRKATVIEKLFLPPALYKASHICTVSESTKEDLLTRFPKLPAENVSVIHAGPVTDAPAQALGDGDYILCIATLCPRKNQFRLIEAYASLPENLRSRYRLILTGGRGWQDGDILKAATETAGVEWKGYVVQKEYEDLLSHATVFAYPSLYEGFGIPVLDALQRGVPVLTSDRGSLKEVAGGAAITVDPENVRSIASGLTAILGHEDVRRKLQQEGPKQAEKFSWKQTVDLFLRAAAKVV